MMKKFSSKFGDTVYINKLLSKNQKDSYFRIIIYLFCLTLLPFDLLTFITGTPSAKAEDDLIEYNLQQSNQVVNTESSDDIRNQLFTDS